MGEGFKETLQKAVQVRRGMIPEPPVGERAEGLHDSARAFLLSDRSLLRTKVRACDQDECVNNNREGTCMLPEITIGEHPQSRKVGCMQFEPDFEYLKSGLALSVRKRATQRSKR